MIARNLPGRTSKQCRARWTTSSNPAINHALWSSSEDEKLKQLYDKHGSKWTFIATHFTGEDGGIRTADQCRIRFNYFFKKV